ncbi:MAG: hypothetical protein AAGC56_11745 [Pseudomonadota bacterium]
MIIFQLRDSGIRIVGLFSVIGAFFSACAGTVDKVGAPVIASYTIVDVSEIGPRVLIDVIPLTDPNDAESVSTYAQALSLFGREDLVAKMDAVYERQQCAVVSTGDALQRVVEETSDANIVIVSESHVITRHRAFIEDLAMALKNEGWRYYAAEAFVNQAGYRDTDDYNLIADVTAFPDEAFFRIRGGSYIAEAQFGRLGRTVKSSGYELSPYEDTLKPGEVRPEDPVLRVNERDGAQAQNLFDAVFRDDPDAKILIHVGLAHAAEAPIESADGRQIKFLAARLKEMLNEDPLTINQHSCRANSDDVAISTPDNSEGRFDLFVDHPADEFVRGRPLWRRARGDVPLLVPQELLAGRDCWRVIEARPVDEPDAAVPMDTVAVWKDQALDLLLPPGEYRLRVITFNDISD